MKKIAFVFLFGSVFLAGCPKHEIIPAPTPKVELSAHFMGIINGTNIELTQNVSGFYLQATKTKIILPSPAQSSAAYYSDFRTDQSLFSLRLGLGSIPWDAAVSNDPSLGQFTQFFLNMQTPNYSDNAVNGFEVVYRDGFGNVWTSDEADPGTVIFTDIIQESDATGDYSKFTCNFDCTLHRTVGPNAYTLTIDDAVYTGWFKR